MISLPAELKSWDKQMLGILITEHYKLQMQTYGGGKTSIKTVTDISYTDTCEIPSTKLSEYVELINKGIISEDANER